MTDNAWYTRQATISKLLTYAAILLFIGSIADAIYVLIYSGTHAEVMARVFVGTTAAALLVAFSAIIDLMIVQAVALHDLHKK